MPSSIQRPCTPPSYELQRIGLFGTTTRNQATSSSDVAVWVEPDPFTPLEELLQRPVDLVRLLDRMNPALRRALLQEGISA